MKTIQHIFQLNLSAREVVWSKRVMAIVMLPIFMFYMTSMNFLLMGMMTAKAADGSGHMTINKDTIAAGGTQTYKLTFDPTESMDGGEVKISIPASWTEPTSENTSISNVGGATFGALSFPDNDIVVPITLMASNQGFTLTLTGFVAPLTTGNYTFTTKTKITVDGILKGISGDPVVTVTAGVVDHYTVSAISNKTVGVDFDVTVTAEDINHNTTAGSGSVDISVKAGTGTGAFVGDLSANTTGDGVDTVTLKYNKVETGIILRASADAKIGDSTSFDVTNIIAPIFSSPGSSTNDSTPLINWSDVSGTGVEYTMKLKARVGGDCTTENYATDLLLDKTPADSLYQVAADEALLGETTYCVKVMATDDYTNSVDAYKTFSLLTSKPATPAKVYIEVDAGANGHPENTINIYNNESVNVKVYHATTLDGGKVYVKIYDELNNETILYNADIVGATDNTSINGIDASSLQQGTTLEISARVEDAGTNSSNVKTTTDSSGATDDVLKDTSSPAKPTSVTFIDNPVNAGNDDTVNMQVAGEGSTIAYYSITSSGGGAAVTGNFVMDEDGDTNSLDINVTSLGDGTLTASIYLTDIALNHSNAKTGTVTKDAVAPDVALTYDLNRPVKNDDALHITATFNEAVKDDPIPQIAINFAGDGSDISATSMAKTDSQHYFYDVDVPAGSDGTATITISNAQDLTGNANNAATNNTFTVDNINPAIAFTNDVASGPVASDMIRITVTETNPDTATYEYGFSADNICDGTDVYGNAFTSGSDFVINTETNNTKYICAKAEDRAGNINYQVSANKLNVDITGPTLSFVDNVAVGPVQSDTIAASWGDATVMKWKYNTNTICSTIAGDYGKTNANGMDQSDATNNTNYICLYAEDALGNKTTLASAFPINIDIIPPVITIANPTITSAQSKTTTASINEAGNMYYAIKNTGAEQDDCDGTHGISFAAYSDITFSAETDNGNKVCYKAVDTAGNTSYLLSNAIAGIDKTAPTLQSFSSSTGAGTYGPASNINITANYDENIAVGSTAVVVLNNGAIVTLNIISGTTVSGSYIVGVTGTGESITNIKVASITSQNISDAAGNNLAASGAYAGTNISDGINIDVTAPAASLSGTPANPTNVTSVDVTVGGEGVVNYQYRLDGIGLDAYSGVTPIATHIIIAGPLAAESHTLEVKGIDALGNVQAVPATYTWVIDLTNPTIASVTADPNSGSRKIGQTVVANITADGGQANLTTSGVCTINGKDAAFANLTGGNYTLTHTVIEGDIDQAVNSLPISCILQEPAGNTVAISAFSGNTPSIDAHKPNSPVISSIAGDNKINDAEKGAIIVIGTAEVGSTVNITLSDSAIIPNTATGSAIAAGDGSYTITINGTNALPSALVDGTITPSVTVTDASGNVSDATTTPPATQDTGIPIAPVVTFTNPVKVANQTNATLNITGETETTYNYTISDGVPAHNLIGSGILSSSSMDVTGIDVHTLAEGTLNISVTLTDAAGNSSAAGTTNITKDTTAPTVTAANIAVTGNNGTGGKFKKGDIAIATWNNTADGNADIASATIDFSQFGGGATVVAINAGGSWSASYNLADDINLSGKKVSVTATDTHGNSTTTQDETSYDVDTLNPTISRSAIKSDHGAVSGYIYQGDGYYVYAQIEDGDGIISSATANVSNITIGETAVALSSAGGPWTIDTQLYNYRAQKTANNLAAEGSKAYTVDAIDIAGNNAMQFSGSVLADNHASNDPDINVYDTSSKAHSLAMNTWYDYGNPYVEWEVPNDNPGTPNSGIAGYYVCVDTANSCDPSSGTMQTATDYTFTGLLSSGTSYYLRMETKDNAGNLSAAAGALFTYKFDNTDPSSGNVTDDGDWTSSTTTINANWAGFSDASGITLYEYSIGTTAGGTDVKVWTPNGTSTSVTDAGLTLATGNTYYVNVRAYDQAENVSDVASSNGITIDTQAPMGTVAAVDTYSQTTFTVSWSGSSDVGSSGLSGHYKVKYKDQSTGGWADWLADTTLTSATFGSGNSPVALVSGHTYYFEVGAQDNAGNWEAFVGGSGEDAILYDDIASNNPIVNGYDTASKTKSLPTNNWYNYSAPYFEWSAPQDLPIGGNSGITGYYVYFGTDNGADPSNYQTDANYTVGSAVTTGQTYYLRIKTKDNAGNISGAETVFTYKYDSSVPNDPSVPASGWDSSTKTTPIVSGNWYNYVKPYFEWTASTDNPVADNAGVRGYYKYLGETASTDPTSNYGTETNFDPNSLSSSSSGVKYFRLKVIDNADVNASPANYDGNKSTAVTAFEYRFDNIAPTTSVATMSPIYDSTSDYIKGDVTISGTSADTGGSGVSRTDVQIKDATSGEYWTGSAWQGGEAWINTGGTTTWSYATLGLILTGRNGDTLEIKSKAYDSVNGGGTNGNFRTSSIYSVIVDVIGSTFGTNNTNIAGETGDTFTFSQDVADGGSGIKYVKVKYWFGAGGEPGTPATSMAVISGDTYGLNITLPNDSLDTLHYYFTSQDNVENAESRSAIPYDNVTIADDEVPSVDVTTHDTTAIAGGTKTIQADVTDNIGVSSATLHYRSSGGSWHTASMSHSGSNYEATIDVQQSTSGRMEYYVTAKDAADNEGNNGSAGSPFYITVNATDLYQYELFIPDSVSAGVSFTATIVARDIYNNRVSNSSSAVITVQGLVDSSYSNLKDYSVSNSPINFGGSSSKTVSITINNTNDLNPTTISSIKVVATGPTVNGHLVIGDATASISGFKATVAGVESSNGEGDGAVKGAEGEGLLPSRAPVSRPWVPYAEGAAGLLLVSSGAWWWVRRGGSGLGGGGIKNRMFYTLKTAASRIRMFLW